MKTRQILATILVFFSYITTVYAEETDAQQAAADVAALQVLEDTRELIFSELRRNIVRLLPFSSDVDEDEPRAVPGDENEYRYYVIQAADGSELGV